MIKDLTLYWSKNGLFNCLVDLSIAKYFRTGKIVIVNFIKNQYLFLYALQTLIVF